MDKYAREKYINKRLDGGSIMARESAAEGCGEGGGGDEERTGGEIQKKKNFSRGIDRQQESHSFSIGKSGDGRRKRRARGGSAENEGEKRITGGTAGVGEKKRIGNYP